MHKTINIKSLRHILLSLVLAILLMHSIVPHTHGANEPSNHEISSKKGNSINDFLKNLLQSDLGEGHLEDFVRNEVLNSDIPDYSIENELDPSSKVSFFIWVQKLNSNFKLEEIQFILSPELLPSSFFHTTKHVLRGPPACL